MIILIGGEKGGTGKTTLATNLAVRNKLKGGDVLIVDSDIQGSASAWASTREENQPDVPRVPSVQKFGTGLNKELMDLATRYQNIIVDSGGRDTVELRSAMTVADKLFIPIQPSQFDVWTLGRIDEAVKNVRTFNEKIKAYVVINRASPNPAVQEVEEAKEMMVDFENLELCNGYLCDRIIFRKAAKSGLSIVEFNPQDPKATKEFSNIYFEVFENGE